MTPEGSVDGVDQEIKSFKSGASLMILLNSKVKVKGIFITQFNRKVQFPDIF